MLTLKELLVIPKRLAWPSTTIPKSQEKHLQKDIRVDCDLGENRGKLHVFARMMTDLPEDFSIGLALSGAKKGNSTLVRVNGWHSSHRNPDGQVLPACRAHTHYPTERELLGVYNGKVKLEFAVLEPTLDDRGSVPPTILQAWDIFRHHASVADDPRMREMLQEMCDAGSQQDFEV